MSDLRRRDPSWWEEEARGRPSAPAGRSRPRRRDGPPGMLGICVIVGGCAVGALVTAGARSQPGIVLGCFLVISTICAVLVVRRRSVYVIIPVPALSYVLAATMAGLIVHQDGTTLTALAVDWAQWVASGFVAMIIATMIAVVATAARWPWRQRGRGYAADDPGDGYAGDGYAADGYSGDRPTGRGPASTAYRDWPRERRHG